MPVSVMSPSSQHHLAVAGCDGRGGEGDLVTLKICECYFGSVFSEDDQTVKVDTEASFERESDPSSEEEILQKDDIEDVEDIRLSKQLFRNPNNFNSPMLGLHREAM